MSLKSSLLALANNIGMCQENARSIKQALAGGLAVAGAVTLGDWELVKTETGKTKIDIPEGTTDIYYEVADNTGVIFQSNIIPCHVLGETAKDYRSGYYSSASTTGLCAVYIKATDIIINSVNKNGYDVSSTATLTLYAR